MLSLEVELQKNKREVKNDVDEPMNTGDVKAERNCDV